MSIEALNWAWQQSTPNPTSKLVLLALADHANGDGECWPSMKKIAVMAQVSPRQVSYHITMLAKLGLVEKASRRRWEGQLRGWNYRLLTTSGSQLPVASGSTASSPAEASFRSEPPENRQVEPLAAAPRKRKTDPLFEAVCTTCNIDWTQALTSSARGRINKAVKELRDAGVTPNLIPPAGKAYRRKYPNAELTPTALAANWPALAAETKPTRKAWSETNWCPKCKQDADDIYHEELCDAYQRYN